jgi:hypothetical protein
LIVSVGEGQEVKNIGGTNMKLKVLIGSGDKIGLLTLPFLVIGIILNILFEQLNTKW